MINEVILPHVKEQRKSLDDENQAAFLIIIDIFRGQMTDPVTQALKNNNIILVKIPPNMTHIYRPTSRPYYESFSKDIFQMQVY